MTSVLCLAQPKNSALRMAARAMKSAAWVKLIGRTDVSGGEDAFVGGAEVVVEDNATFRVFDADFFEIEFFDIGCSADGVEKLIEMKVIAFAF